MKRLVAMVLGCVALAGCAAPTDSDGELVETLSAAPEAASATPVVVDTDLGGDDLVALAFLLRHPQVHVDAITIAATGLVGCDPGVDLVADLLTAFGEDPVEVACGRADAGPAGMDFPEEWRTAAGMGSGMPRSESTLTASTQTAQELIGERAESVDGLVVVALGPLTNLADVATSSPNAYARLARVVAMGGSVDGPIVDGIVEYNAAADPAAFSAVLAAGTPLTVVPEDSIPVGTPASLSAPVVRQVAELMAYPKWWDLAAAAFLVAPHSASVDAGGWALDEAEPGRLSRGGYGTVEVVRELDAVALEAEYARAFQIA